ncbi:hypothetical protein GC207_02515 [bacterium]|nr:hypothetical protein [bacterium]
MNKPEPANQDEKLSKVLHEWKSEVLLPPRFQERVWQRIQSGESAHAKPFSVIELVAHWIGNLLPRPAAAAVYVALLIAVGATVGWTQAHQTNERVMSELGDRYVRVLDPFQSPRN